MRLIVPILLGVLVFCVPPTAVAIETGETGQTQLTLDDMRTFADVFNLVRNNYVDEIGDRELLEAATREMVLTLDPHSKFLGPDEFRRQDDRAKGRLAGVGIDIDIRNGRLLVRAVTDDGPAAKAGVEAGDIITAVDGEPVKGRPVPDSVQAVGGLPGTEVELTLKAHRGNTTHRSKKEHNAYTVRLTRAYRSISSVIKELKDGHIAYLRLTHFHTGSAEDMRSALSEMEEQAGADGLNGVIIDLRDNLGGVIMSAAHIADGFLDEGLVVHSKGRYEASQFDFNARPGQWVPGVPVAILINRFSASASEILAGALQDHQRATLIGETSYGKGTVQSVLEMRNGSALKLTTARYYRPSGADIDQVGVTPDVIIETAETDSQGPDEALATALEMLGES